MTNWVTIKIPEDTRDDAKEVDGLTYEQLITLGIQADGADIVGKNDNGDVWLNLDQEGTDAGSVQESSDTDEIHRKLDQIQSAQANTVSDALDIAEEQDIHSVLNRIDDLETELKTQIEGLKR